MTRPEHDRTRLDLNPMDEPAPAAHVAPVGQPVVQDPVVQSPDYDHVVQDVEEEVVDSRVRRVRTVRTVCTVINLVCSVFAVVLAVHIVLVLFDANPRNGFASFVNGWSGAVSLGLRGLFTPDDVKLQTLFNDGMAALAWLVIAAALTYAIRQFALPGPRTTVSYRRRALR
jgi:hypothetical protein